MSNYIDGRGLGTSRYSPRDWSHPINQIPNEILTKIMFLVRDAEPGRWTRILRVSHRWEDLAKGTPMLWTRIVVQENFNILYASMHRAGPNRCLDVCVPRSYMTYPVMDALAGYTSRLRKLSLREIPIQDDKKLRFFLSLSLPSLEKLELGYVTSYLHPYDTLVLPLSAVFLPSLTSLSVNDINLSISSKDPLKSQSLRRLRICHKLRLPAAIYMGDTFSRVLRAVPNVEELTLEHVPFSAAGSRYEAGIKVALPKLRLLQLTGSDCFVHDLLQLVDVPSRAHVRIQCDTADTHCRCPRMRPSRGLLPSLTASSTPLFHMLPLLREVTNVDMTLVRDEHVLFARGPSDQSSTGSLVVTRSTPVPPSQRNMNNAPDRSRGPITIADLVSIVRCSPVQELCIDVGAEEFLSIDWRLVFTAFPQLRSLRVLVVQPPNADTEDVLRVRTPSAYSVFAALDPAFLTDDQVATSTTSWSTMCPHLERFGLEGYVWIPHRMVQECLRNRMRVKGTHRLENLIIDPIWYGTECELKQTTTWYEERVGPMVGAVVFGTR